MPFAREIGQLFTVLLVAFILVALAAGYWAFNGATSILLREDNPRLVEAQARILRGMLLDRNNMPLVQTSADSSGLVSRQYAYPAMDSALGYYSLRYGTGGAEAAYDALLSGTTQPSTWTQFWQEGVLHQARQGADIRLTFDLKIQQELAALLDGHTGAAILMTVPDGNIVALVSLPTFDPNHLDETWDNLIAAPSKPFFNRALQGHYQPGALLQTPLIAAALLTGQTLETPIENATVPVRIANAALTCAAEPPDSTLTLHTAYLYACPAPFSTLVGNLGVQRLTAIFTHLNLTTTPMLAGFYPVEPALDLRLTTENAMRNALGQGELTVSPLNMALVTAAIVNDGNAPAPNTLLAQREPQATNWTLQANLRPSQPMFTAETAQQLRDLLRESVTSGAATSAAQDGLSIGGQVAVAYAGDQAQTWFIGFVALDNTRSAVIALVLEDSQSPKQVAQLGGEALAMTAHNLAKEPTN